MTEMAGALAAFRSVAGALLLATAPVSAATPDDPAATVPASREDARIAGQLKALDYQYVVTEDRDYRLIFEIGDDKRTQAVVANSNTEFYNQAELREIWSIALKVAAPIDPLLADRLLKANNNVKLGAWREWPGDKVGERQEIYIVFAAQIDAKAPNEVLDATLNLVSQTADDLEKELTQQDER